MVLYECNICNYNTIRKNQYNRHLLTKKHITNKQKLNITNNLDINLKQSKVYSCNCGKVFNREDNLLRHYKNSNCIQKKSSVHQCKNCGKKYSTSFN